MTGDGGLLRPLHLLASGAIEFVDELPRNAAGKVLERELEE